MADLRRCLGLAAVPPTALTRLLVVELPGTAAAPFEIGLVVDTVCEIAVVAADAVEPPPGVGGIAAQRGSRRCCARRTGWSACSTCLPCSPRRGRGPCRRSARPEGEETRCA